MSKIKKKIDVFSATKNAPFATVLQYIRVGVLLVISSEDERRISFKLTAMICEPSHHPKSSAQPDTYEAAFLSPIEVPFSA